MKLWFALLSTLFATAAFGQTAVKQSGSITPTHAACWTTNGIIQDCATAAIPFLSTIGTVGQGDTICAWSALSTSGASQKICLGANTTTGADITVQNFGTAPAKNLTLNLNGIAYPFPGTGGGNIVGPSTTVVGDLATWNNVTGTLLQDAGGTTVNGSYVWSGASQWNATGAIALLNPSGFSMLSNNPLPSIQDNSGTSSWAAYRATNGTDNGTYFGSNGTAANIGWGSNHDGFAVANNGASGRMIIGAGGAAHLFDYPSGGIWIGTGPSDPGANNLVSQSKLFGGGLPSYASAVNFNQHTGTNQNLTINPHSQLTTGVQVQSVNDAGNAFEGLEFAAINTAFSEGAIQLGTSGSIEGTITFQNATSGGEILGTVTGALNSGRVNLPNVSGTDIAVTQAFTQSLTNKTVTSSTNTLGGVTMGLGSDSTGDIYYNNSGVLTRLPIGSSTNVLAVSGGAPHWSTAVGGGMTYLCTITASNSASLNNASPTSGSCPINNTYTSYVLIFQNIIPATDEKILELQIHSGGAYKATGYVSSETVLTGSTSNGSQAITTFIPLSFPTDANSAALHNAAPGYSGRAEIINPSANALTQINVWCGYLNGGGGQCTCSASGFWNTTGVVDGFQVLMDSGNITSGSILVYGIT